MSLSSHQSPVRGATDVWLTPPHILDALGPFDLDPCASLNRPWDTAARHYTIEDDGLSLPWEGFCWVNPPFGPEAQTWLARLAEHGNGIGLVPARTETRWFVSEVWQKADAILFLHGRPHFHRPDGTRGKANSGAPICLIAYGGEAVDRLDRAACPPVRGAEPVLSGSLVGLGRKRKAGASMNPSPYNAPAHTSAPNPAAGTTLTRGPLDLAAIAEWTREVELSKRAYDNRDHEMAIEMRRREQWALAADARKGRKS